METLIAIAVFGVVGAIMYLVLAPKAPIAEDMIQRRLETISGSRTAAGPVRLYDNEEETFWERIADFFFGSKEIPEKLSKAGVQLHQAGIGAFVPSEFIGACVFFSAWLWPSPDYFCHFQ